MELSPGYYTDENEPPDMKTYQILCQPGSYCPGDGFRYPCPEGRYGSESGLSTSNCSGPCAAGYYCRSGSISDRQFSCGNVTVYCPKASPTPILVEKGYYSVSEHYILTSISYAGPNSTHDSQLKCEVGYYCVDGVKYQCPSGTYGWFEGANDVSDCRTCQSGHYCPSHPGPPTTEDTQVPCGGASLYCPPGSSKPLDVDVGHYSISESEMMKDDRFRSEQVLCPPGFHCQNGIKTKCPRGTYGEVSGLVSKTCTGLCPRGFFCPENSVNPLPCSPGAYSTGAAWECTSCQVPSTISIEVKNAMCRHDRSCCFKIYDLESR